MSFNVDYIINLRDKATAKLGALDQKANKTNKSFSGLGATLGRVFAVGAIAVGAKKIATLGIEMEQTRVSFATFLGDAGKANALIAEMNEFANVTPFDNAQIIGASKALLTAGVTAEGMTDQLKTIGDVAAGAGVPITELSQIFAKATNKGKLQAEELNQFAERGIPILDVLAKKWGMNKAEVLKMGSQGKITADVMKEAFETMSGEGGRFFNMMDKQSKTTGGKISTLIGKLQMIGIKIGEALLPALSFLTDLAIKLTENTGLLKDIGIVVGIAATAFGVFKAAMFIATLQTTGLTAAQWLLNIALNANPIGLIVIAIAALAAAVVMIIRHYDEWGASMTFLLGPLGMVINLIQAFRRNWDDIKKTFSEGSILDGLKKIGAIMIDSMLMPLQQLLELASKLPGVGDLAGKGAAKIEALRKRMGINTEPLVVKEVKEGSLAGLGDEATKNAALAAAIAGGSGGVGKGLDSGIDKVTSSAPKTFNINIDNLVKEFKISTTNMTENVTKTKEMITQALITAVNDVSIIDK